MNVAITPAQVNGNWSGVASQIILSLRLRDLLWSPCTQRSRRGEKFKGKEKP
jgi:hypothetical protein